MPSDARAIAAGLLLASEQPGDFLEHRLENDPGFAALSIVDRRLATELVFGVTRWRRTLDWLSEAAGVQRPPAAGPRVFLRLGLYQLFWLDRIPPFAAVYETVRVARQMGFHGSSGFINAVLRRADRERHPLEARLQALRKDQPDLGWSHPGWLIERWRRDLEAPTLDSLLAWNNSPPPTLVRRNALSHTSEDLSRKWRDEGVEFEARSYSWTEDDLVYAIRPPGGLDSLPSFQAGGFYVQDPSTLLAPSMLAPRPGERILDACAAPGGKTTFLAQLMQNQGLIVASDSSLSRLRMVRENCQRLGVGCVTLASSEAPPAIEGGYDRVLVDAPCSNTGVLRRRVELRWRLQPEDILHLAEVQSQLLAQAAALVRPGGRLVYSTCSLEPEENLGVVHQFLSGHPHFESSGHRQLHPIKDGVDGGFVVILERNDSGPGNSF